MGVLLLWCMQLMDEDEEASSEAPSSTTQPPHAPPHKPEPQQEAQQAAQQQQEEHTGDAPPTATATAASAAGEHLGPQQLVSQQLGLPQHAAPASASAAATPSKLGGPPAGSGDLELDAYMLLDAAVAAPNFLNFRPSVTAAAVLYTAREWALLRHRLSTL